mgnify:CR=1 FL=1
MPSRLHRRAGRCDSGPAGVRSMGELGRCMGGRTCAAPRRGSLGSLARICLCRFQLTGERVWQGTAGAPIRPQAAETSSTEFHVVAKRDDTHAVSLDGRKCQVSFRAANSAHGERWKMELTRGGDGSYECRIEDQDRGPPHASFYGWSAHMHGAKGGILEGYEVWTHEGVLLLEDGYLVEGAAVRSDSHWNLNGLSKIIIRSS